MAFFSLAATAASTQYNNQNYQIQFYGPDSSAADAAYFYLGIKSLFGSGGTPPTHSSDDQNVSTALQAIVSLYEILAVNQSLNFTIADDLGNDVAIYLYKSSTVIVPTSTVTNARKRLKGGDEVDI